MDAFERQDLTPIVNASGTMTYLGASIVLPEAIAAGAAILPRFVLIDELQARASTVIARATGSQAGFMTACTAAGISLGIAGAMTGCDLAKVEQLPDTTGLKREILIPRGHLISYGAPVDQAIRLTGARVVAVGEPRSFTRAQMEAALAPGIAAALYVVSHHVNCPAQVPMAEFIEICHARGVPAIVDMASEQDLKGPIAAGADLVIHSAHKFLGGPTGAIVAGRRDLVSAAYLQNRGLGRGMKIGKEGILGAMAALDAWARRDHGGARNAEAARLRYWREHLALVPGLSVATVPDWTGNPVERLEIRVDEALAGIRAWELADRLAAGRPSIHVRDDRMVEGYFYLDPCNLHPGEEVIVAEAIAANVQGAIARGDGRRISFADRQRAIIAAAEQGPFTDGTAT